MSADVTIPLNDIDPDALTSWAGDPGILNSYEIAVAKNRYVGTIIHGNSGFMVTKRHLIRAMMQTDPVHTGEWQAMKTVKSPAHATWEILDATLVMDVPMTMADLILKVDPDLPWAEEHFLERVSGTPMNPAPSHIRWPYGKRSNSDHTDDAGVFSHTYPERFWPRNAGGFQRPLNTGIRFSYGDLQDVVSLLVKNPMTRQAYLPIWFPEDLTAAAVCGERVPCTLGYHFLVRDNQLSCRYFIRSCDVYRHYTNDVYMAGRLMQWVCDEVNEGAQAAAADNDRPAPATITPGQLRMNISSLHAFVGDKAKLEAIVNGN